MANPESLIDVNTGNSLGYQNDPAVAGAVIPRVAVVSTIAATQPSGSSANQIQLVDSAGNPLSSYLTPGASNNSLYSTLLGPGGFPIGTTRTPGASPVALITGSYPILLASWANVTITSTQQSPTFDARPYQNVVAQIAVTAISGSTASVALLGETQEPSTGTWWSGSGLSAISSISTVRTDGSIIPLTGTLGVTGSPGPRLIWPNSRITLLVVGGSTSITLSAYVWGF